MTQWWSKPPHSSCSTSTRSIRRRLRSSTSLPTTSTGTERPPGTPLPSDASGRIRRPRHHRVRCDDAGASEAVVDLPAHQVPVSGTRRPNGGNGPDGNDLYVGDTELPRPALDAAYTMDLTAAATLASTWEPAGAMEKVLASSHLSLIDGPWWELGRTLLDQRFQGHQPPRSRLPRERLRVRGSDRRRPQQGT